MSESRKGPDRRELLRMGAVLAAGTIPGVAMATKLQSAQPRIIKTLTFLVRKPGATHEEFMNYWLGVHAPMSLKVPGMRGMICNEIISASNGKLAISSGTTVEIDGVAESWKEETSSLQNPEAPAAAKAWYADGPMFVGQIKGYRVEENVFVRPKRGGVGLMALLKRKPEHTHAQFAEHWLKVHGPMAHDVPEVTGLILNEVTSESARNDIPPLNGFGEIDGIAQSFRTDMDAPLSPQRQRWYADGQASIGEAIGYRTREHVIIEPS